MSLPVKLVSNLCLLIHILYMLLQYYKLVLFFFFNCKEKNTHKIKDPRKVDNELWSFSVLYDQGKCTIKKGGNKTWTGSPHLHTYETKVPIVFPMCKVNELIRSEFCTYLSQNLAWWKYSYLPFMAEVRVRWWVLAMAQRYHRTHMRALHFLKKKIRIWYWCCVVL